MIKTFRGILGDGVQTRIRLSTKKGKIGYKIVNFTGIPKAPMTLDQENVLKLFKIKQTSVDGNIDFSDGNLIGVVCVKYANGAEYTLGNNHIIFEHEVFNQDIYITHEDVGAGGRECNYYLELETFTMSDNATAVSTLRDIRLNPQVGA